MEVLETSTNVSSLYLGETLENISRGVDMYTYKNPLGVVAGICPFNFPVMIPLWMYPVALVCGNTCIFKPSERVANSAMILAELLHSKLNIDIKINTNIN
jgi:malonate-semialdehyde dehydrogenase (acetylating)/methylmalonate-semialdehyde dehydrogenase